MHIAISVIINKKKKKTSYKLFKAANKIGNAKILAFSFHFSFYSSSLPTIAF